MKTTPFTSCALGLALVFVTATATMAATNAPAPAAKDNPSVDTKMFGWLRKLIAPANAVVLVIEEHGRDSKAAGSIAVGAEATKGSLLSSLMRTSLTWHTKDDVEWSMGYSSLKGATNIVFASAMPNDLPVVTVSEEWKSKGGYAAHSGQGIPASVFNMSATLRVMDPAGKCLFEKQYTEAEYKSSYSGDDPVPSTQVKRAVSHDLTRGATRYEPLTPKRGASARSAENTTWEGKDGISGVITLEKGGAVRRLRTRGPAAKVDPSKDRWQQVGDVVQIWFNDGFGLFEGRLTDGVLEGNQYSSLGLVRSTVYRLRQE